MQTMATVSTLTHMLAGVALVVMVSGTDVCVLDTARTGCAADQYEDDSGTCQGEFFILAH